MHLESQSDITNLEMDLKRMGDEKQELERQLRLGFDDKESFEKVNKREIDA